jgi:hypothetical protein
MTEESRFDSWQDQELLSPSQHPHWLWVSLSLLSDRYWGFLPLGWSVWGREVDHSPPSNASVRKYVEIYFHSPICLYLLLLVGPIFLGFAIGLLFNGLRFDCPHLMRIFLLRPFIWSRSELREYQEYHVSHHTVESIENFSDLISFIASDRVKLCDCEEYQDPTMVQSPVQTFPHIFSLSSCIWRVTTSWM